MIYGIRIERLANGQFVTTSRDVPELTFISDDEDKAYMASADIFPACFELHYRQQKKPMPLPSPIQEGEMAVFVPVRVQARILLWNTVVERGLNMKKFAKTIGVSASQAQRLVDFTKNASIENIEHALSKLGRTFELTVSDCAYLSDE